MARLLNNHTRGDPAFHRSERLALARGGCCEFNAMIALLPAVFVAARKVQLRSALKLVVRNPNRPEAERRKGRLSILDSLPAVHAQVQDKGFAVLNHERLAAR